MHQSDATLALRILPQAHVCRSVREAVATFAHSHDVPRDDLENFQTAVGEALANAIEHGASADPIDVEVRVTGVLIVAIVSDCGIGFALEGESTNLPAAVSERGRGFPIMRRCSDVFGVESEPGGGTRVVVGRYLRRIEKGAA